jgi:hypothetical protein
MTLGNNLKQVRPATYDSDERLRPPPCSAAQS